MKIMFISLGCDKNLVDTEVMMGHLCRAGYTFTDDEYEAEVIVINSCCFIQDAKEESIQTIIDMARMKEEGKCIALIVAGCLAQRYRDDIKREIPEADGLIGTASFDSINEVVKKVLELKKMKSEEKSECFMPLTKLARTDTGRVITTGGWYSYLKIAEGCNKRCTYCIIPKIRGNYRSTPMEDLIREAEELAKKGVRELIIVAQETTLYGTDIYGKKMLPKLLTKLCDIDGIYWIRLLYCYPEEITGEFIDVIKSQPKICHYLDIPIQHADDDILKKMGRRTSQKDLREIIRRLRDEIPDIILRTTLISGFPQETDLQHEELYRFADEMEFDRLGVFAYSPEEDTPAADFPGQIDEDVKEMRRNELMELQQEIAFEKAGEKVGNVYDVLIEGKIPESGVYVGRTYMDAPNVDGLIFVDTDKEIMSGDFVKVRVTKALEYDLMGEVAE